MRCVCTRVFCRGRKIKRWVFYMYVCSCGSPGPCMYIGTNEHAGASERDPWGMGNVDAGGEEVSGRWEGRKGRSDRGGMWMRWALGWE